MRGPAPDPNGEKWNALPRRETAAATPGPCARCGHPYGNHSKGRLLCPDASGEYLDPATVPPRPEPPAGWRIVGYDVPTRENCDGWLNINGSLCQWHNGDKPRLNENSGRRWLLRRDPPKPAPADANKWYAAIMDALEQRPELGYYRCRRCGGPVAPRLCCAWCGSDAPYAPPSPEHHALPPAMRLPGEQP